MNSITLPEKQEFLSFLEARFLKNMHRHEGMDWKKIEAKLLNSPDNIHSLLKMEKTGGEPDVVKYLSETDAYVFFDCSEESPKGRRSLCYDREALDSRKENKPQDCVLDMAKEMGIELLTEDEYRLLQNLNPFDLKTSSWIQTPHSLRKLGGALFCDRRYDHVFTYHNGADSYYAARGFRGKIIVL